MTQKSDDEREAVLRKLVKSAPILGDGFDVTWMLFALRRLDEARAMVAQFTEENAWLRANPPAEFNSQLDQERELSKRAVEELYRERERVRLLREACLQIANEPNNADFYLNHLAQTALEAADGVGK